MEAFLLKRVQIEFTQRFTRFFPKFLKNFIGKNVFDKNLTCVRFGYRKTFFSNLLKYLDIRKIYGKYFLFGYLFIIKINIIYFIIY